MVSNCEYTIIAINTISIGAKNLLFVTLHVNVVVSSGGAPTPTGTSVFTKHNWNMGMGICGLMGGAFMAYWVGHL